MIGETGMSKRFRAQSLHLLIFNRGVFIFYFFFRMRVLLRNLELILFGCHSSACVVVELGEELPSPADIQLAHGRLRALCLGGGERHT